ncbi:MAG: hypothetical protein ACO4CG_16230 [Prochlorothrix sp.]|nr:hypothetical protein [Prochlorothrix sp.]
MQSRQILVLPQGDRRLYGEVIDVDEQRQRVWLRPLILVEAEADREEVPPPPPGAEPLQASDPKSEKEVGSGLGHGLLPGSHLPTVHRLQDDSHLLWPLALFEPALDTELLPFWLELTDSPRSPLQPTAAQAFRQFIAQVWAAHPQLFHEQSPR